jgi:hypothetical protein
VRVLGWGAVRCGAVRRCGGAAVRRTSVGRAPGNSSGA